MNKLHQDFQQGDKLKLNCAVEYSGRCRRLKGEFIDKPLSSVFEIFTLDSASVFAVLLSVVYICVPLSSSFGFPDENTTWRDILTKENAK